LLDIQPVTCLVREQIRPKTDQPFGILCLFCFLFECLSAVACLRYCLSCF